MRCRCPAERSGVGAPMGVGGRVLLGGAPQADSSGCCCCRTLSERAGAAARPHTPRAAGCSLLAPGWMGAAGPTPLQWLAHVRGTQCVALHVPRHACVCTTTNAVQGAGSPTWNGSIWSVVYMRQAAQACMARKMRPAGLSYCASWRCLRQQHQRQQEEVPKGGFSNTGHWRRRRPVPGASPAHPQGAWRSPVASPLGLEPFPQILVPPALLGLGEAGRSRAFSLLSGCTLCGTPGGPWHGHFR